MARRHIPRTDNAIDDEADEPSSNGNRRLHDGGHDVDDGDDDRYEGRALKPLVGTAVLVSTEKERMSRKWISDLADSRPPAHVAAAHVKSSVGSRKRDLR